MELWQLYLLVTLPNLGVFLGICSVVALLVGALSVIPISMEELWTTRWRRVPIALVSIGFLFGLISVAIPSQTGLYTLIGGYYITNVEGIKDLPPAVVKAANKFLENYTEEKE